MTVTELPDYAQQVAGDLSATLVNSAPVWEGFDTADYPTVVIVADENDDASGALTGNHPEPGAVGLARSWRLRCEVALCGGRAGSARWHRSQG